MNKIIEQIGNREIKFRGKRLDNGEWVYGYFIEVTDHRKFILPIIDLEFSNINESLIEVDPKTVGQYTGLKDKNGKEIYDGYIIKIDNGERYEKEKGFPEERRFSVSPVIWMKDHFGGYYQWNKDDDLIGTFYLAHRIRSDKTINILDNIEIIGNVFENPELLT